MFFNRSRRVHPWLMQPTRINPIDPMQQMLRDSGKLQPGQSMQINPEHAKSPYFDPSLAFGERTRLTQPGPQPGPTFDAWVSGQGIDTTPMDQPALDQLSSRWALETGGNVEQMQREAASSLSALTGGSWASAATPSMGKTPLSAMPYLQPGMNDRRSSGLLGSMQYPSRLNRRLKSLY